MASGAQENRQQPFSPMDEHGGDTEMAELADFFLTELQDRMAVLSEAFESGDQASLRAMAHQLKDAADGFGFPNITQSAGELEAALLGEEAEISAIAEKA